jgi:hypothetical protein
MKKTLLILLIIFLGCTKSKEEDYKAQLMVYFKETMHNPSSFELVSFYIVPDHSLSVMEYRSSLMALSKEGMKHKYSDSIFKKKYDSIHKFYTKIYDQVDLIVRGKDKSGEKFQNAYLAEFKNGKLIKVEE